MDLNCFIRISGLREAAVSTGGLTGSAVLFAENLRFSDADVFFLAATPRVGGGAARC